MSTLSRARTLVPPMVVALACQSASAATPLVSANASISNLTFRLIDLDVNDGITPGMVIQGQGHLSGYVYDQTTGSVEDRLSVSISGQSFSPQTFTLGNTTSALGANSLSASSVGTVESALAQTATDGYTSEYDQRIGFSTGHNASGSVTMGNHPAVGGFSDEPLMITLTANTGLVIEGTASTALTVSDQGFEQLVSVLDSQVTGFSPEAQRYVQTQGSASASVQAALVRGISASDEAQLYTTLDLSMFYYNDQLNTLPLACDDLGNCAPVSGPDRSSSFSQNFALQYANFGSQTQDLSLLLSSSANSMQGAYLNYYESFPYVPTVPTIPEPGTWALMGLGLLGLGWARRRQLKD